MEISRRRMFSPDEDEILKNFVKENGNKDWGKISQILRGRTPRQCRDRYRNYLKEGLNSHPWTEEEDSMIKKMYNEIGPKWVAISKKLNDRNGIDIKNRWTELNSTSKVRYNPHNYQHFDSTTIQTKDISTVSDSNTIILKNKVFTNDNNIKTVNSYSNKNELENMDINNPCDIAISEEEFYNFLSIWDWILPMEEYNLIGSNKSTNLF